MNKKISLSVLLTLAMVFTLSACGGQATMEGGTTDPGQIVETSYPIQIKPLLRTLKERPHRSRT